MSISLMIHYVLWLVGAALQSGIAIGMVRKKLHREFPFFYAYTIFHIVQAVIAFTAYQLSYTFYFYTYWVSEGLDAFITLVVIQEIFSHVFRPYEALRQLGDLLFRWAALIMFGLAIITASASPGVDADRWIAGLLVLQRSVTFIQAGLLLFLFLFCRMFGLTWRHYVFGITLGFGLYATLFTAATALRAYLGASANTWYGVATAIIVNLGLVVWLYYIVSLRSSSASNTEGLNSGQIGQWNRALQELMNR